MSNTDVKYGAVAITRGKHTGHRGMYDDDTENGLCIVYLDNIAGYFLFPKSWLLQVEDTREEARTAQDADDEVAAGTS